MEHQGPEQGIRVKATVAALLKPFDKLPDFIYIRTSAEILGQEVDLVEVSHL